MANRTSTISPRDGATHWRLRTLDKSNGYWQTWRLQTESGLVDRFPVETFDEGVFSRLEPGVYRVVWLRREEATGRLRPIGNSAVVNVDAAPTATDSAKPNGGGGVTPPASGQQGGQAGVGPLGGTPAGREPSGPHVQTIDRNVPEGNTIPTNVGPPSSFFVPPSALALPPALAVREPGRLETGEVLAFLRGLAWVVQQVTDPVIRGVQEDAAARMQRDRSWFDSVLERERQQHVAALERDRQFSAAIQAAYARPDQSALDALKSEVGSQLAVLSARLDSDEEGVEDDENADGNANEKPGVDNPWSVAKSALEHAPDIIKTIADLASGSNKAEAVASAASAVVED